MADDTGSGFRGGGASSGSIGVLQRLDTPYKTKGREKKAKT